MHAIVLKIFNYDVAISVLKCLLDLAKSTKPRVPLKFWYPIHTLYGSFLFHSFVLYPNMENL